MQMELFYKNDEAYESADDAKTKTSRWTHFESRNA